MNKWIIDYTDEEFKIYCHDARIYDPILAFFISLVLSIIALSLYYLISDDFEFKRAFLISLIFIILFQLHIRGIVEERILKFKKMRKIK